MMGKMTHGKPVLDLQGIVGDIKSLGILHVSRGCP